VRSDIYSLGETLWFALTGKTPFAGRTLSEIHRAQKSNALPVEQLKAAHVPHRLKSLLESMLAFEPASRPGTGELAARLRRSSPEARSMRRTRAALAVATAIVFGVSTLFLAYRSRVENAALNAAPDKSIAVLPFENLSADPNNVYFTDGVQDEVLTRLASVADLKVISRTSVMQYKSGIARDLRKIGQQLGVARVVEGTVQRAGNRVRVNAQLIDVLTNRGLWGQTYDRDVADLFAIQSEIAEQIVSQLKSKLSPREKAAMDVRPTWDLEAFDLYLQAKQLINTFHETPDRKETLLKALRLLDEAISRDPNFTVAYCWAARANEALYWFGFDAMPARLAQAKVMAQKAIALDSESGEARLAQARIYYRGDRDYARAREELAIAKKMLPNSAEVYSVTGWIDRRQGRWEDAVKNLEKAAELDPRNSQSFNDLTVLYDVLRRYDDEESVCDRAIVANPSSTTYYQMLRAQLELAKGNTQAARRLLDSLRSGYDPDGAATSTRFSLALYEHDAASATKIIAQSQLEELADNTGSLLPRDWFRALAARASGDAPTARDAFSAARIKTEAKLHDRPNDAGLLAFLGLLDAGLARANEALAEGRRAVELRPISEDALEGVYIITKLAMIYAWLGDNDAAIERLTFLAKTPGGPDYGQLKLDPAWDGLRGDGRFAKIVEDLKPRSAR
jgi:TolB-like protein/Tfp pilus assembly protein PilF